MENQDYEKAKYECWKIYVDQLNNHCTTRYAFDSLFDRAYRLGMEAAKKEQNQEPKFKVGDKVIIHGVNNYLLCGKVGIIKELPGEIEPFNYKIGFEEDKYTYLSGKYLEPYTEPQEEKTANTSDIDIDEIVSKGYLPDPTKDFDNIIKDGFRNERRLNIAAMMLQGILSNNENFDRALAYYYKEPKLVAIAKYALACADALIAESEKGGSK